MQEFVNRIICGDCLKVLKKMPTGVVDLVFADPPFNIGYEYDNYNDELERAEYLKWSAEWIRECTRVLKANGSFYIAIGDEYAAEVKHKAEEDGLVLRNWIIWHYTFGQQTKNKFARSHTHIFYFVRNKDIFKFRPERVRVISDRQKIYRDKRANPEGKMPDDVWNEYPRLCGTHLERIDFPCQMPESLLARIIRVSSDEGDWVLDPFSGSGTTSIVAAKLNRKYTGIELSRDYASESRKRIEKYKNEAVVGDRPFEWTEHADQELKWLYHENKVPTEQLIEDDYLLMLFTEKLNGRLRNNGNPMVAKDVKKRLTNLRKRGALGPIMGEIPRRSKRLSRMKGE